MHSRLFIRAGWFPVRRGLWRGCRIPWSPCNWSNPRFSRAAHAITGKLESCQKRCAVLAGRRLRSGPAGHSEQNTFPLASFEKAVYQLAKVMLHLNLPEAKQARRPDRSELLQRLRGLGPKKDTRLKRKLARTYDRIVIGGRRELGDSAGVSADSVHGSVPPHWRCGHFRRIRFGEGFAESRLG